MLNSEVLQSLANECYESGRKLSENRYANGSYASYAGEGAIRTLHKMEQVLRNLYRETLKDEIKVQALIELGVIQG